MADIELRLISETKDVSRKNGDTKSSISPDLAPTEVDPLAFDTEVAHDSFPTVVPKTEKYEPNYVTKPKTSENEVNCDDGAGDQSNCAIVKMDKYLPMSLNSDESNATDKSETTDQASSSSDGVFTIFAEKEQEINKGQKKYVIETKNWENKIKDNVSKEFINKYNGCDDRETDNAKFDSKKAISETKLISATSPIHLDTIKFKKRVKSQLDNGNDKSKHINEEKRQPHYEHMNGKHDKNEDKNKRQIKDDAKPISPSKKLCQEIEKAYPQHDFVINDYIQTTSNEKVPELQLHTEQLLTEIHTLRDLAQKKELEWNNILHLKKIKEEILLRLLRKKQVMCFEKASLETKKKTHNPSRSNYINLEYFMQPKGYAIDRNDEISGVAMKATYQTSHKNNNSNIPLEPHYGSFSTVHPSYTAKLNHSSSVPKSNTPIVPKPHPNIQMPNFFHHMAKSLDHAPMGRQGPIKDVKSIIADYRQRHPEAIPKRGRRLRSLDKNGASSESLLPNDARMSDLGLFLSSINMQSQKTILDQISDVQASSSNGISFKDVLVKIANMQTCPVGAPLPPLYPEISLHPVSEAQTEQEAQNTSSLLHGILTKQQHGRGVGRASTAFSPTLARLLTAPNKTEPYTQLKNCGEITITPLNSSSEHGDKARAVQNPSRIDSNLVHPNEDDTSEAEEGEGSLSVADTEERLVIDEEAGGEGEAPRCQGCLTRDAKFVCAGCANQWYCSRQCQVAAWDDHSEMCS